MRKPVDTLNFRSIAFLACLLICHSIAAFSQNDDCSNALPIVSSISCTNPGNNVPGIITPATTFTATTNACGTNPDVWYTFVAQSTNPTITLNGSTLPNGRIQVL